MTIESLNYIPEKCPRELKPFYIGASEDDIQKMLQTLGLKSLNDVFSHLSPDIILENLNLPKPFQYNELIEHVNLLASKNKIHTSFIGDGLLVFSQSGLINEICSIRGLTTAYTPYQPERSQGTLQTLWIYQSLLSMLTGFEAINASLYDRSTCLFEAFNTALRLKKDCYTVIVSEAIYPGDKEVLNTYKAHTKMNIIYAPLDPKSGTICLKKLNELILTHKDVACFAFNQVNSLGVLENVDALTDFCTDHHLKSIAIIEPMLIAASGLKPPSMFGSSKQGCDMFVGEGHNLALAPNLGGPGLGIFGIRFNEKDKNSIRSTAGRFIGKTQDIKGRNCKALILSTREQHIRREKATSNICSNQSFVASLAGANLLALGDEGMNKILTRSFSFAQKACELITSFKVFELKYPDQFFFQQVLFKTEKSVLEIQNLANLDSLELGVDVSSRLQTQENLLLMSFNDLHTETDLKKLESFLTKNFKKKENNQSLKSIPTHYLRTQAPNIPKLLESDVIEYYQKLGAQNLSPDDGIYPLGSCTMKYNPFINDYAASLNGFTQTHPQSPIENIQGSLEVLYEIQEMFKHITGLKAVTTQPVAGAQGELVGLKMFQAYHEDRKDFNRDLILIPRSAHGTNPATATMAGFETKTIDNKPYGIFTIEADQNGEMNLDQIKSVIIDHGSRICGIMVTNPNTAGIFERNFKEMSELIHQAGGLVYMDGANMNAIAGIVDLNKLGVDAVHNNLHKTWTIPHGGGGPGDAIVAVSHRLIDFLPGIVVLKENNKFSIQKTKKSIGSIHRHYGNFAHKVRAYTYLKALGKEGVIKMSSVAVLSARYLYHQLASLYPTLPQEAINNPRMHEFILTITPELFQKIEKSGTPKAQAIARIGKLFLDFGFHAPTVAFPEQYGLMIEPTETYSKSELDQFIKVVKTIFKLIESNPEVLKTVPHFTPIDRVDELAANKNPLLSEVITKNLDPILKDRTPSAQLRNSTPEDICDLIIKAHEKTMSLS